MCNIVGGRSFFLQKTTKGKVSNEWTVSGYESDYESTNTNQIIDKSSTVLNGNSLNSTGTYPGFSSTVNYETVSTVNEWTYIIDKDGTWNILKNTTKTGLDSTFNNISQVYDTFSVSDNWINESSGVWMFLGKTKTENFKKNERVTFNTLTKNTTL
jgi:hypothetical protein